MFMNKVSTTISLALMMIGTREVRNFLVGQMVVMALAVIVFLEWHTQVKSQRLDPLPRYLVLWVYFGLALAFHAVQFYFRFVRHGVPCNWENIGHFLNVFADYHPCIKKKSMKEELNSKSQQTVPQTDDNESKSSEEINKKIVKADTKEREDVLLLDEEPRPTHYHFMSMPLSGDETSHVHQLGFGGSSIRPGMYTAMASPLSSNKTKEFVDITRDSSSLWSTTGQLENQLMQKWQEVIHMSADSPMSAHTNSSSDSVEYYETKLCPHAKSIRWWSYTFMALLQVESVVLLQLANEKSIDVHVPLYYNLRMMFTFVLVVGFLRPAYDWQQYLACAIALLTSILSFSFSAAVHNQHTAQWLDSFIRGNFLMMSSMGLMAIRYIIQEWIVKVAWQTADSNYDGSTTTTAMLRPTAMTTRTTTNAPIAASATTVMNAPTVAGAPTSPNVHPHFRVQAIEMDVEALRRTFTFATLLCGAQAWMMHDFPWLNLSLPYSVLYMYILHCLARWLFYAGAAILVRLVDSMYFMLACATADLYVFLLAFSTPKCVRRWHISTQCAMVCFFLALLLYSSKTVPLKRNVASKSAVRRRPVV